MVKKVIKEAEEILKSGVRLVKIKAVRAYADRLLVCQKSLRIFLNTFASIIPFGDYYKKDKAVELIWSWGKI